MTRNVAIWLTGYAVMWPYHFFWSDRDCSTLKGGKSADHRNFAGMLVSVWAMIITHYSNINEQESEGTEHYSVFSLCRCRICENTLEEMLMN